MRGPRIAIVSRNPVVRLQAAKAFDYAPAEWLVALFEDAPIDADVVVYAPDVPGDGIALDLDHPEKVLAAIEERLKLQPVGAVIEVTSTGGGTGCTSVALHLASFMSRTGPALYVESNTACGGRLRLALDTRGPSWADTEDLQALTLSAIPFAGGFRGLFAPGTDASVPPRVLESCSAEFSSVVVDRGPRSFGVFDTSKVVLVMSPSVPSARRAAAILEERPDTDWTIVTNRLGPGSETTDVALDAVLEHRRIALALPCSPSLRDAEDTGSLLGPRAAAWSRRVAKLSEVLTRS